MEEGLSLCLQLIPIKVRRREDDEFFEDGNVERFLSYRVLHDHDSYNLSGQSQSLNSIAVIPASVGFQNNQQTHQQQHDQQQQQQSELKVNTPAVAALLKYVCCGDGCVASFETSQQLEMHFRLAHTYQCNTCKRSFTTNRLLGMHISEQHDTFFELLSKKKASYECIVDGCGQYLWTKADRYHHLVGIHKYPVDFDFDNAQMKRKIKTNKNSNNNINITSSNSSSNASEHISRMTDISSSNVNSSRKPVAMDVSSTPTAPACVATTVAISSKNSNNTKRVECRHYQRGFCRLGEKCTFKHSTTAQLSTNTMALEDDDDTNDSGFSEGMQIDSNVEDHLVNAFTDSARISIPKHISFGKKQQKYAHTSLSLTQKTVSHDT